MFEELFMFVFTYLNALFGILCWTGAALILYENRRNKLSLLMALVIATGGSWALSNSFADVASVANHVILGSGLALISFVFFTSCFIHFTLLFVNEGEKIQKYKLVLAYLPAVLLSLFAFSRFSVESVNFLYTEPSQIKVGPIYTFGPLYLIFGFLYAYSLLIRSYKRSEYRKRMQIIYIIVGTLATLLGAIIFDIALPVFGVVELYGVGPLSTCFLIASISYAILKHKLVDIRVIVQRGIVYLIILGAIGAGYLLLIYVTGKVISEVTNTTYLISGLITTIAGIFLVPPLEQFFRKITDRFFFKDRYNYANAMHDLSFSLNRNLDLSTLMLDTTNALRKIFKVAKVTIVTIDPWQVFRNGAAVDEILNIPEVMRSRDFITDQPQVLLKSNVLEVLKDPEASPSAREKAQMILATCEEYGYTIFVKIVTSEKIMGVLAMSEKLSGDNYTPQDIQLLKTFSHQAAVAIEKSLLYAEVKEHVENLEIKVRSRTKELEKLQQGQKDMMENISHGLQTPLTILRNELATFSKDPKLINSNFTVIEKSIDYISSLIYGLLRLSRLETLNDLEQKVNLDFSALLNEVIEYVEVVCEQKDIKLKKKVESGINIWANREQITELVQNLFSNAIRYTENCKKKEITVTLETSVEDGVKIMQLSVADTGIGIAPEEASKIFERFYRTDLSKATSDKGIGLGLAVCQQIVKNHHGKISVESAVGKGSTFTVQFDCVRLRK